MQLATLLHPPARRRDLYALSFAALVLGVALGTQWRTNESRPLHASRYSLQLSDAVLDMQKEQDGLKAQLADLRTRLNTFQQQSAVLGGAAAELQQQADALAIQAGLVALSGPGVRVTLDDAKLPADSKDVARAIIHSQDITDVANVAWKAGAEAIAINGERITGTSACVGAVIQINGTLMSPPFVFSIIGPRDRLLATLGDSLELAELKDRSRLYLLGFTVAAASDLQVPGYTGPLATRYAHVR